MNLNSIAENFSVSRPAISQHIKLLTECGLVIIRQQGRERFCEARLAPLGAVADWIEPFRQNWERQFTALDQLLDQLQSAQTTLSKRVIKSDQAAPSKHTIRYKQVTKKNKAIKNKKKKRP
jgi:hypothetical protein